MDEQGPSLRKSHRMRSRPDFECIALLLQGGGALGSYQGGVYQALAEAGLHPDWVAGISIGAINSALIAGNPPERRVDALRGFWETVTARPVGLHPLLSLFDMMPPRGDMAHAIANQAAAFATMVGGAPGFFMPRPLSPYLCPPGSDEAKSFYDVSPLKATLETMIDFERINAGETRLSVGAVNVTSGNFEYFDSTTHAIRPEHIMASGALPPGFPAVEIEGDHYWDGGLVSNTPLQWVLGTRPRMDTLAFQVDLWNARGDLPANLVDIELRQKEIRFSSRTRAATDGFMRMQSLRRALGRLIELVPPDSLVEADEDVKQLLTEADDKVYNVVHLIYRAKRYEGTSKDYEFSRRTMEEHWKSGYQDAVRTLRHPEIFRRPTSPDGVSIFDLA